MLPVWPASRLPGLRGAAHSVFESFRAAARGAVVAASSRVPSPHGMRRRGISCLNAEALSTRGRLMIDRHMRKLVWVGRRLSTMEVIMGDPTKVPDPKEPPPEKPDDDEEEENGEKAK